MRSEAQDVENDYLAPLAPKCIQQKDFLPPANPIFPCQDISKGQSQKTLAYAQAMQYWVEKSNPPMPSQPCLLVECMLKLRWAMETYITFSDDAVLGVLPLKKGPWKNKPGQLFPRRPSQPLPMFLLRRWPLQRSPLMRQTPWRNPLRSQC